jgi:periplasmic mercuric ion binding protein
LANCSNQNTQATAEKTVKVWGNCEQCKATIEKASTLNGVVKHIWNEDSKLLSLKLDTTIISVDAVLKSVAESGYDNERYTANSEAYSNLPECCQYERKEASN